MMRVFLWALAAALISGVAAGPGPVLIPVRRDVRLVLTSAGLALVYAEFGA